MKRRRKRYYGETPPYAKAAPHRHGQRIARQDLERGLCRVCTLPVLANNGRVRSWHDGRALPESNAYEPNCLHVYKMGRCGGRHLSYVRTFLVKRDGRSCAHCNATRGKTYAWLHVDHITPLADGGPNDESNLQLLCPTCHKAKTAAEATARAQRRRTIATATTTPAIATATTTAAA